ncbi:hypothetical protein ES705_09992 [subsurface metagenome]
MDKTTLAGFESGVFDPRVPRDEKYKRDPQRDFKNFMEAIPKAADIVSLKKRESYPGFVKESIETLAKKLDDLAWQFQNNCCTFEVIKKEKLINRIDAVRDLLKKPDFGLTEIKTGIIDTMGIQGVLLLAMLVKGGGRGELHGGAGAIVQGFKRLLEVF